MTTIHQLKPITVQDEDGNNVTIEYSTYIQHYQYHICQELLFLSYNNIE
jgi:hypothetical protein